MSSSFGKLDTNLKDCSKESMTVIGKTKWAKFSFLYFHWFWQSCIFLPALNWPACFLFLFQHNPLPLMQNVPWCLLMHLLLTFSLSLKARDSNYT